MAKTRIPQQGEIWLVQFEPQVGTEIMKTRPAVVLTNDALRKLTTRIVVPVRDYKTHHAWVAYFVPLQPDAYNHLSKPSMADCSQIKSFDLGRFQKRLGMLATDLVDEIIQAVNLCIER